MVTIDAKCFASIACSMNNEKEGEMNKYDCWKALEIIFNMRHRRNFQIDLL